MATPQAAREHDATHESRITTKKQHHKKPQARQHHKSIMFRPLRSIARQTGTVCARWTRVAAVQVAHPTALTGTRSMYNLAAAANNTSFSWLTQQEHRRQQFRTIFIETEDTPNPESMKFIPSGRLVLESEDGTGYFVQKNDKMEDILRSPLATKLFKIEGVKAVYLGFDFVTITKYAENKWRFMRPDIFSILMDFFESNKPVLVDEPIISDTTILEDDDEIVAMIKELIETRIRPAVQEDGGDIRYISFDEETGLVTVKLAGSCVGCPSSSVTLKQGVENMLTHYIPEVTNVVALEEEAEETGEVSESTPSTQKSYEERLAAAGIPFSD